MTQKTPSSVSGDTGDAMRLNKALAQAGVCSRRAADDLIRSGRVFVNGNPADLGTPVRLGVDDIRVDGKPLGGPAAGSPQLYYILNKPIEVVTTVKDPEGRRTVLDLMGEVGRRRRLFPVGRLDYFSEGLLILTTDGELANRLMHPRWHMPKLYRVAVRGDVSERALGTMRSGMTLAEGERLAPVKVQVVQKDERATVLEMELVQGVNRQIRRMCRDLGLIILQLVRVSQGPLALADLPTGRSRPLTPDEVAALKKAVGL
ncbi:pseudouridine synthase [Fundidesulfovibrio putealis]|uniref:pseudouridine synthase n=1 Tax=Fundidesulfovibrio putealis TaxID=270496 RepID=UPI000400F75A|nr:pseudouridine synthase [Fundidesulfovibrio putealis]